MKPDIGTTKDAPITKVGHTNSGVFGSEPMAKIRGRDQKPSPQEFNGSGSGKG